MAHLSASASAGGPMSIERRFSRDPGMALDELLEQGPLQVKTLWDDTSTAALPRLILQRRRRQFILRSVSAGAVLAVAGFGTWFAVARNSVPQESERVGAFASPGQPAEPVGAEALEIADLPNWDDSEAPAKQSITLADGSSIVSATHRLHISRETPQSVIVIQEEGVASFFVVATQRRSFQVLAGDLRVTTTGGEFDVERSAQGGQVTVRTGSVRVRALDKEHRLEAGDSQTFTLAPDLGNPDPSNRAPRSGKPVANDTGVKDWRLLAEQADYVASYAALKDHLGSAKPTSADLMLAADVARFSRHPVQAAEFLSQVSAQFPGDPLAPLAAFTRGRVLIENLGQPAAAASAFALSRKLAPGGSLAADALVREIDARASVGQQKQVRALASEYLRSYPQGRHRAKCEKLVTKD